MINFLKRLFGFSTQKQKRDKIPRHNEYVQDHDIVDYDGMGNQGRFPTHK